MYVTYREEIGSRYGGDDQGKNQDPSILLHPGGEHGVFRSLDFPQWKEDEKEYKSDN